jgi:hypothetical protein
MPDGLVNDHLLVTENVDSVTFIHTWTILWKRLSGPYTAIEYPIPLSVDDGGFVVGVLDPSTKTILWQKNIHPGNDGGYDIDLLRTESDSEIIGVRIRDPALGMDPAEVARFDSSGSF